MTDDDNGGQRGAPRFRTVREIARGGMGRVMEAIDTQLGRTVAVKEVLSSHPDARRRFDREIAITARLEHPSIVPLYDAGTSPAGDPFYVMRKLTGTPLDRVVKAATSLDRRLLLLPNLLAVADAVAHAHGRGVIHRDLKPSNVLVGDLGDTVVIDWGLAKIVGDPDSLPPGDRGDDLAVPPTPPGSTDDDLRTEIGTIVGTPGFMPPEQARGETVDARGDVYALGACLYYLLAGEPAIASSSHSDVLQRTVAGEIPALADRVPGVPKELVTIVDKAMAAAPEDRYLDAGGFSEDLRRFLGGQLVASHRYGVVEQIVRWVRRRRALVIAIVTAAVVIVSIGVVSIQRIVTEQHRAEDAAARERDRADALVITQAQGYLDSNPTLAIATLVQLRADSPRWPGLAATIAEARSKGVASGYPGDGGRVTSIDGMITTVAGTATRVVTSGNGQVWLDDLARHTATKLVDKASPFIRARLCGDRVVLYDKGTLAIVETAGVHAGTRVEPSWPSPPRTFTTAGQTVVVAASDGAIYGLDLAVDATPYRIGDVTGMTAVEASPSGDWLVLTGPQLEGALFHHTPTGWQRAGTIAGDARGLAFSPDETRVAYLTGASMARDVIERELPSLVETRRWPAMNVLALEYANHQLVAQTMLPGEFRDLGDHGTTSVRGTYDSLDGRSLASFRDYVIALKNRRTISITAGTFARTVTSPVDALSIAVVGHHLVATGPDQVLAWDLDDIVPARLSRPGLGNLAFATADRIVAETRTVEGLSSIVRLQLHDPFALDHGEELARIPMTQMALVLRDGSIATIDRTTRAMTLVEPKLGPPELLRDVTAIAPAATGHVWAARDGSIVLHATTDSNLGRVELRDGDCIINLVSEGGWTVAASRMGTIWRRDPDGAITTADGSTGALALDHRVVYLARGTELVAWSSSPPTVVATLPRPISWLRTLAAGRLAIETDGGGLSLFEATTNQVREVAPVIGDLAFARDNARAIGQIGDRVDMIDLITGEHWPIIERVDVQPRGLALSPDGRVVLVGERVQRQESIVDRVVVPSPEQLHAWAITATNAAPPSSVRGALAFRVPATVAP